jgi:hypothetical protein
MINEDFQNFFLAIAGASAALIGLLFVAVSVAPEEVLGPKAHALHQIRATMALTAFGSTLVMSLLALLPNAHIGLPATAIGTVGVLFVVTSLHDLRTDAHDPSRRRALVLLATYVLVNLFLTASGIRLLIQPKDLQPVSDSAYAAIALIALGIDRSWELVGGRSTGVAGRLTDRVIRRGNYETNAPRREPKIPSKEDLFISRPIDLDDSAITGQ